MVHLEINGHVTEVEPGTTILQAAEQQHIDIPTMCYLEGINQVGACRMCAVEVEGRPRLMTACETEVTEGMVVRTNSARARHAREVLFELLMSDHPSDCLHCARDGDCELQDLGYADSGDGPIASAVGDSGHTGTGADTYDACARFAWKSATWEATNCNFSSSLATM